MASGAYTHTHTHTQTYTFADKSDYKKPGAPATGLYTPGLTTVSTLSLQQGYILQAQIKVIWHFQNNDFPYYHLYKVVLK